MLSLVLGGALPRTQPGAFRPPPPSAVQQAASQPLKVRLISHHLGYRQGDTLLRTQICEVNLSAVRESRPQVICGCVAVGRAGKISAAQRVK